MYIIVGFKVESERSVYYAKAKDQEGLARAMVIAFVKRGAEFVSVRYIRKEY